MVDEELSIRRRRDLEEKPQFPVSEKHDRSNVLETNFRSKSRESGDDVVSRRRRRDMDGPLDSPKTAWDSLKRDEKVGPAPVISHGGKKKLGTGFNSPFDIYKEEKTDEKNYKNKIKKAAENEKKDDEQYRQMMLEKLSKNIRNRF